MFKSVLGFFKKKEDIFDEYIDDKENRIKLKNNDFGKFKLFEEENDLEEDDDVLQSDNIMSKNILEDEYFNDDDEYFNDDNSEYENENNFEYDNDYYENKSEDKKSTAQKIMSIFPSIISNQISDSDIISQIMNVIRNKNDEKNLNIAIEQALNIIGLENIERLEGFLINRFEIPLDVRSKYKDNISWNIDLENAILSILQYAESDAVDELLKISMLDGLVKFKAINILCRMANRNIQKDVIVDSIIYITQKFNEEEQKEVLTFLSQIKNSEKVNKLLNCYYKKYIIENKVFEVYSTLADIVDVQGYLLQDQLRFLKAVSTGQKSVYIELDGDEFARKVYLENIDYDFAIKCTILFLVVQKTDNQVNEIAKNIMNNSDNEEIKGYLSNLIQN